MGKWPVKQQNIQLIQFQLSNFCNLACPSCSRTWRITNKEKVNDRFLDLNLFKTILKSGDWPNLKQVIFCGNIDDPTMHPELQEMVIHALTINENVAVEISTNASTRTENYYAKLGNISSLYPGKVRTLFAIDGLEDTNHIYRIGSNWSKIQKNYRAYISAGGYAVWQFVLFDHNKHQLEEVKALQKAEGFSKFLLRHSGRSDVDKINVTNLAEYKTNEKVVCSSLKEGRYSADRLFINHLGQLSPCCWIDISDVTHEYKNIAGNFGDSEYNLHYSTVDHIMNGKWFDWIYDNFEFNEQCKKHCKFNIVDICTQFDN